MFMEAISERIYFVDRENRVLIVDRGPEPWTWWFSIHEDGSPMPMGMSDRVFTWSDLELMLDDEFVERSIDGGLVMLKKVGDVIRVSAITGPSSSLIGEVQWDDLLLAAERIERRRTSDDLWLA